MHQTRGSVRDPRNRRRWAPAACVLALALACPATALGAPANGNGSHRTPSKVLLAWGSGYASAHGSPLVREVQRRLAAAGYGPGPIDGRFGSLTSRAVIAFQASQRLQVDGIVGPDTWAALNRSGQELSPGAGSGPAGSQTVRTLQRSLALAGYSPGPIDGRYGPLTTRAVRRFQTAHGLPANGIAGAPTLARIAEPVRPLHTSGPHGSQHPSLVLVPAPHGAGGRAGKSPIPTSVKGPSHGTGTAATALLAILLALGAALILVASRYARRRAGKRASSSSSAMGHTNGAGALGHENGSGALGHTNGAGALAHTNGAGALGHENGAGALAHTNGAGALGHDAAAAHARADHPGEATAAFNLGVLLEERGDLAGAAAAYRRADEHGHGAAASNLGVLLEESGASAQAEAAYRRADQRGDAAAAFNLGVLLEERGDLADAEAAYRRADQRGNGGEIAHLARAALLDLREAVAQPSPTWAGGSR